MNSESFQFWFFSMLVPVVGMLVCGAALIVWIVMSQRTKRQAIAAGVDGAAYRGFGPRWMGLRVGVFCIGLGLPLILITAFDVKEDSGLAWGLILLGTGGALLVNHLLVRRYNPLQG
ncbi:MAG TPA: hypothetical protein VGV16_05920 [Gammaproteobacteria bacterium]|nr:hypothetical protein [Gammaproteobacteria bacterium]